MDGTVKNIPREKARKVLPVPQLLRSPALKSPISALFCQQGKLIPVYGPIGEITDSDWLLLLEEGSYLIRGLPSFSEDQKVNLAPSHSNQDSALDADLDAELAEIENLLKSA
jgi:hypothetical protein